MRLEGIRKNAIETIEANQRLGLAGGDPSTTSTLNAEKMLKIVDEIVPQFTAEEIARITAGTPGIDRDMRDCKDIKDKYGLSWNEMRMLKDSDIGTKTTEAQRRATAKYDKANTKAVTLKLNRKTDADILAKLEEVGNVQGYIKQLIRADIEA